MKSSSWISRAWKTRADATTFTAPPNQGLLSPQTTTSHYRKESAESLLHGFTTTRKYDRSRQRRQLLAGSIPRQLITIGVCGICGLLLRLYNTRSFITDLDKQAIVGLITFATIGIALNFAAAFRSYARIIRWRILAGYEWPVDQFDLILKNGEMSSVIKLICFSWRPKLWFIPSQTQIFGTLWLLLNFGGAILVTVLSLSYTLEKDSMIAKQSGVAEVLDLSNTNLTERLFQYGIYSRPRVSTPALSNYANLQGLDAQEILHKGFESIYEVSKCADDCNTPASYTFQDRSARNPEISSSSDRTVSSIAACNAFNLSIITPNTIQYVDRQGTSQIIPIGPVTFGQNLVNSTVYIPGSDPRTPSCGPRCAVVYVLQLGTQQDQSTFYQCSVQISQVNGTISDGSSQRISDALAKQIGGAIAAGIPSERPNERHSEFDRTSAWALRPTSGTQHLSQVVSSNIASFAMSALAVADSNDLIPLGLVNETAARRTLRGPTPFHPWRLIVDWPLALAILIAIPLVQIMSLVIAVLWATKVIVRDDSDLATAKLLFPLFTRNRWLYDHGCLMNGAEIIEGLGGGDLRLRYGVETYRKDGTDMGRTCVKRRVDGNMEPDFPEIMYD